MMKYLLCILSFAFLLIGGSLATHKEDAQGFRETAVISVDSDVMADTTFSSSPEESHSLGILTTFSLPRNITPVRTLKFNDIPVVVQLLSSRSFHLPEERRKILLSDTNYLKYYNRYYIYTLAHILI